MRIRRSLRSRILKRTQKGSEDEWTGMARPAVNGIELRNLCFLLDPAQGLFTPEGNTGRRGNGEGRLETRSRRPIHATHRVIKATSETLRFFPEL